MKKKLTFEQKIIRNARDVLLDWLDDFPEKDPRRGATNKNPVLGICYSKKKMEKIKERFDKIQKEGKKGNLMVSLAGDNTCCVMYEYIFLKKITKD